MFFKSAYSQPVVPSFLDAIYVLYSLIDESPGTSVSSEQQRQAKIGIELESHYRVNEWSHPWRVLMKMLVRKSFPLRSNSELLPLPLTQ